MSKEEVDEGGEKGVEMIMGVLGLAALIRSITAEGGMFEG